MSNPALDALRHHVSGAVARGEKTAIQGRPVEPPVYRYVNAYVLAGGTTAGIVQMGEAKHTLSEAVSAGQQCSGIAGFTTLKLSLRGGLITGVSIERQHQLRRSR